jgi:hypothetical protein
LFIVGHWRFVQMQTQVHIHTLHIRGFYFNSLVVYDLRHFQ